LKFFVNVKFIGKLLPDKILNQIIKFTEVVISGGCDAGKNFSMAGIHLASGLLKPQY
jgi:hypothetical protein